MAELGDGPRHLVRQGYDQVGERYLEARPVDGADVELLEALDERLTTPARVVDVGCGAGVPVAQRLIQLGHSVVGIDFSYAQLRLASHHLPDMKGIEADMLALPVGSQGVDALVCFYALIHVPRAEHSSVFEEFHRVLRPGGWALLCIGKGDNPEDLDQESWLGTPMYWSHFAAGTTMMLLTGAGFEIVSSWEVADPMGHGSHCFVLAQAHGLPERESQL